MAALAMLQSGRQWLSRKRRASTREPAVDGQQSSLSARLRRISSRSRSSKVHPHVEQETQDGLAGNFSPVVCAPDKRRQDRQQSLVGELPPVLCRLDPRRQDAVSTADTLRQMSSTADTLQQMTTSTVDSLPQEVWGSVDGSEDESPNFPRGISWQSAPEVTLSLPRKARDVRPWTPKQFEEVSPMEVYRGSLGCVDVFRSKEHGRLVAVKRLPRSWTRSCAEEFKEKYPRAAERPWLAATIEDHLQQVGYPHICELLGVFQDDVSTFFVNSFAAHGDLFAWCAQDCRPGRKHEARVRPLARQLVGAVRLLHDHGISHRNISLENAVLEPAGSGTLQVKLINFANATLTRKCRDEVRGKAPYQAPEMHYSREYDAFLSDAFAVGVMLFVMSTGDYPWLATRPGACKHFGLAAAMGIKPLLESRTSGSGRSLLASVSPALLELLQGLLLPMPWERLTLGEKCWQAAVPRPAAPAMSWLAEAC